GLYSEELKTSQLPTHSNCTKAKHFSWGITVLVAIAILALLGLAWFYWSFFSYSSQPIENDIPVINETVVKMPSLNFTLVPRVTQLNDSVALQMAELTSKVASTYWERWQKFGTATGVLALNVTHCRQVKLTSPFLVHHSNLYWQDFEAK